MQRQCLVPNAFAGEDAVGWLISRHPQLCKQLCPGSQVLEMREAVGELTADKKRQLHQLLQKKGAIRLGNVLRQKGFLRKVQTAVTVPAHVGALRRHPDEIDWQSIIASRNASAAITASHFRNSRALFCIDMEAGELLSRNSAQPVALKEPGNASLSELAMDSVQSLVQIDLGAFMERLPDKREMRHRTICRLAELDADFAAE
jgi:hypothetical protein